MRQITTQTESSKQTDPPTELLIESKPKIEPQKVSYAAFTRAIVAFKAGDLPKAEAELREAAQSAPDDAAVNAWLGFVCLRQEKFDDAIAPLEKANTAKPDEADIQINLAYALFARPNRTANDTKRTIELYEKAITKEPGRLEAHYNLAAALTRMGDYKKAAITYKKITELRPTEGQAFLNLGQSLMQTRQYEPAREALQQGTKLLPKDPIVWTNLGLAELALGKNEEAILSLEEARKRNPAHYETLMQLGNAYVRVGKRQRALVVFGAAAEIQEKGLPMRVAPDKMEARFNQAFCLHKLGRIPEAMDAYNQVLERSPDHVEARINYGYVLYQAKKYADSARELEIVTQGHPEKSLAWSNLGAAYEALKAGDKAIVARKKAYAQMPNDYDNAFFLAQDYTQKEKWVEASVIYKAMGESNPKTAEPLLLLGRANMALNRLDDAQQVLLDALRREPGRALIYSDLGFVYERKKNALQARVYYKKALALDANCIDAQKGLSRLGK
jgi:tetratricopeptide (TPR) repeat protein